MHDETLHFFVGREDRIQSFTRRIITSKDEQEQIVYRMALASEGTLGKLPALAVTREVHLRPAAHFDALSQPPSVLKSVVAKVEETFALTTETTCRASRYKKDYTQGTLTARLWDSSEWQSKEGGGKGELDGVTPEEFVFVLGADGMLSHTKGAAGVPEEELAAQYEQLLLCEAAALHSVLTLERARERFAAAHLCSEEEGGAMSLYAASLPLRLSAAEGQVDRLLAAMDHLDSTALVGGRKGASYDEMAEQYESKIAALEQKIRDIQRKGTST